MEVGGWHQYSIVVKNNLDINLKNNNTGPFMTSDDSIIVNKEKIKLKYQFRRVGVVDDILWRIMLKGVLVETVLLDSKKKRSGRGRG